MLSRPPTRGSVLVSFSSDLTFLIFIRPPALTEVLLFSWCIMARCREQRQGETFKTHLPHKYPLQHNHKTEMKLKKRKNTENMVMLFTQLSLSFLDLNYKHTSIFQLHISPTYSVPLDRYSLLLLETLLLCQQCYKQSIEWQSDIQDRAV